MARGHAGHECLVDRPLASGSPGHGVATRAPNVTRIVVEGAAADEWLRLTIDPRSPVAVLLGARAAVTAEREGVHDHLAVTGASHEARRPQLAQVIRALIGMALRVDMFQIEV